MSGVALGKISFWSHVWIELVCASPQFESAEFLDVRMASRGPIDFLIHIPSVPCRWPNQSRLTLWHPPDRIKLTILYSFYLKIIKKITFLLKKIHSSFSVTWFFSTQQHRRLKISKPTNPNHKLQWFQSLVSDFRFVFFNLLLKLKLESLLNANLISSTKYNTLVNKS